MTPRFVPNVASRTVEADTRRKVLLTLTIAYILRAISYIERDSTGHYGPKEITDAILRTNVPAWVVIYAVLAIASDFGATRDLSVAFAILILVAVALNDGPRALRTIEEFVEPKQAGRRPIGSDGRAASPTGSRAVAGPNTPVSDTTSRGGWPTDAQMRRYQQRAKRLNSGG